MSAKRYSPIVLLILDGWGLSPAWGGNAIAMSNPSFINYLWSHYPHLILQAFRKLAGPTGKVSNSEIGHGSIGCGRLIYQEISKINQAIANGSFFQNPVLKEACAYAKKHNRSLHLLGLISDGSIHSHIDHLFALISLAKREEVMDLFIHGILDGRDTPTTSGLIYTAQIEKELQNQKIGRISTLMGRVFAMDRDGQWERTKRAYQALTKGQGLYGKTALSLLASTYRNGFTDEYIPPLIIPAGSNGKVSPKQLIQDGDSVIFFNFRADRARQLTRAFVDSSFRPLWCFRKPKLYFVTFTQYQKNLPVRIAFPSPPVKNCLAEILSQYHLRQLHLAESEKYAHVTYFFNGGREEAFPNEDRLIIPSPRVVSFDRAPRMKANEIAQAAITRLKKYHFVVANIANVDMVGHTGNMIAISEAIMATDQAVAKITEETLKLGGAVLITADHGNAEQMVHLETAGDKETLHTLNPVPFILVTPDNKKTPEADSTPEAKKILQEVMSSEFTLADVAPTVLDLFGLPKPKEMTGQSLLRFLL